jgi:hypothetical protein
MRGGPAVGDSKANLEAKGWHVFECLLDPDLTVRLQRDLMTAYGICRAMQIEKGLGNNTDGSAHHIVGMGGSFIELLDQLPLWSLIREYFSGEFIINSCGGFINKPNGDAYVGQIHRDVRTFRKSEPLMINMLVMLDEFTLENGATHILTGSHLKQARPDEKVFWQTAERAIGPVGSVLLFNSNLWHAAGQNRSPAPRRALTLTFTPPFFKQQCDYPRLLGYEAMDSFYAQTRQVLGYNARVPASLDEWYQPPESRIGESLLTKVGLQEFVAHTPREYVNKAVEYAARPDRLAEIRSSLRQTLTNSPMTNPKTFTEGYEAALRGAWIKWYKEQELTRDA